MKARANDPRLQALRGSRAAMLGRNTKRRLDEQPAYAPVTLPRLKFLGATISDMEYVKPEGKRP